MSDDDHDRTMAKWQQRVLTIGDSVWNAVNLPEFEGTSSETGYILIFFNAGRAEGTVDTMVSSDVDPQRLEQILKGLLKKLRKGDFVGRHIDRGSEH